MQASCCPGCALQLHVLYVHAVSQLRKPAAAKRAVPVHVYIYMYAQVCSCTVHKQVEHTPS